MSEREAYIYAYFGLDDQTPRYIGKGKGNRWLHRGKSGRNKHFLNLIQKARALGKELLRFKLLEGLSDEEACLLESDLIRLIGREAYGGPLVNLTDGGDGPTGYRWTDEQRKAHGEKRRGKKHSPEWRAAISTALKGKAKSPQHIANAAAARRGKKRTSGWWSTEEGRAKQRANNPAYHAGGRKPPSEETKAKISAGLSRHYADQKSEGASQ